MPIRTSIETLRKLKVRDPSKFDGYFEEATAIVLTEVSRLARLVASFAAYARLPDPKLEHFDLGQLCREIVVLFGQTAEARGVTVELDSHGPLPVHADRDQLNQAISNLIKNAIEAALSGSASGTPGHVWVTTRGGGAEANATCKVVVEDSGPGIPQADVARLFTPYETTKSDGTGLGLPIAQRIAVEHGGDLTYASRPAGGATFTFTLKCAP